MFDLLFVTEPELAGGKYHRMTALYMNRLTINEEDDNEIIGNIKLPALPKYDGQSDSDSSDIDSLTEENLFPDDNSFSVLRNQLFNIGPGRWNFDPQLYKERLEEMTQRYNFAFKHQLMVFHTGKMTISLESPRLQHKTDNAKFQYIQRIIKDQFSKINCIFFTQMILDYLVLDPNDSSRKKTAVNECYDRMSLICEADVLQFFNLTNDHNGYFTIEELGFDSESVSVTQGIDDFYAIIFEEKFSQREKVLSLVIGMNNMFHFKKLDEIQKYDQIKWLAHRIIKRKNLIGNVFMKILML